VVAGPMAPADVTIRGYRPAVRSDFRPPASGQLGP
jgi:hypothetical protein